MIVILVVGRFCGPVTGVRCPYHHESPLSKLHATLTVDTLVLAYLGMQSGCRLTLRRNPKWFNREKGGFSNTLWSVLSKLRHVRKFGDPLHPFQSPVVLTWSCHWTLVGHGRESEVDIAQLFFTLNKVIAQVIYHSSSHSHKSCGDRQAAKRQVWVY